MVKRTKSEAQKKETAAKTAISAMMEQLGTAREAVEKKSTELTSYPVGSMPFSSSPRNENEQMLSVINRTKSEAQKKETAAQTAISAMMEQLGTAREAVEKKSTELTSYPVGSMPFSSSPRNENEQMLSVINRTKSEAQKKETVAQTAISAMMEQLGTAREA